MNISNITPPQVWTASSRSLTNFGSGALAATSTVNTTLAGATQIDLRPSVGIIANAAVGVVTGAAATAAMQIQIWDGTTAIQMAISANGALAAASFYMASTSSVGLRLNNTDATHAGNYEIAQYSMTI